MCERAREARGETGRGRSSWVALILFLHAGTLAAQDPTWQSYTLLGGFSDGWLHAWEEQHFTRRRATFTVVTEGENRVLRVESDRSASGIWRSLGNVRLAAGRLSWRWKVAGVIPNNTRERERRGDDFVARVFVVFDPRGMRRGSEAICYVWASSEAIGSMYPSAYAEKVAMVVLRTGEGLAGQWIQEERDFIADYREFFGRNPELVSFIAIMVDTDDTASQAQAWFDDVILYVGGERHE